MRGRKQETKEDEEGVEEEAEAEEEEHIPEDRTQDSARCIRILKIASEISIVEGARGSDWRRSA